MGSTLTNGIYLPAEGERNCYTGLAANWSALDSLIGGYNAHIGNTTIHVTAEDKEAWNGKADNSALTAHTGDTTIHVTSADKQAWNGKADASALTAHTGDTTIHVTAEDKAKWDAVTSKADDSDVVHKSGNETVGGQKTFSDDLLIYNSDNSVDTPILNIKTSKYVKGDTTNTDTMRINFLDSNGNNVGSIYANKNIGGSQYLSFQIYTTDNNDANITSTINYYISKSGDKYFLPYEDSQIALGGTVRRWKSVYATNYYYGSKNVEFSTKFVTTDTAQTISGNKTFSSINGVEPSSLSLPSGNANDIIDISSYITNLNGTANSYTVPANGWISIAVVGTAIDIVSSSWSDSRLRASSGNVRMLYPVLKNETLAILITGTTLAYARFIPCQGDI